MITTTKRSLDFMRGEGYIAWITEQNLSFPEKDKVTGKPTGKNIRMKRDLFNCFDLVAVHADRPGTMYIQTTTRDHQAERLKKIIDSPYTETLIVSGNRVIVHGWAKVGARGKAKFWKVTVTDVTFVNGSMTPVLVDLAEQDPEPTLFAQTPAPETGDDFDKGEVAI